ncbi:MAG: exodeoxyribonuclease I [Moraxellaceae bacterium]|nr:MAG: exodeoxyribonuclease I [Moraxellaceae bacterium]
MRDVLTAANNLQHEAAHDALSDVYATIAMAKLIKTVQPKLYDYAYRLRDKRFAGSLIDIANQKPLLHISSRFPGENGNLAIVLPLAIHPSNKNSVIAYNLCVEPSDMLRLPVAELRHRLFSRADELPEGVTRIALKEVHLNKTPMLLTPAMLDTDTAARLGIDRQACEQHWRQFVNLTVHERQDLQQKLHELYSEQGFAAKTDPEQMLYEGFFDDHDRRLMAWVRNASPSELGSKPREFHDGRLDELLFRYRARNFPESLSATEQAHWRGLTRSRLTDPLSGSGLVYSGLMDRINHLLVLESTDARSRKLLSSLATYANELLARVS